MTADTKGLILDTAEVLFAEGGFASTSLRTITARAGVNLASVNYHFGSKEALIRSLFERRITPMNRKRLSLLDGLRGQHEGAAIPLGALIDAFMRPALGLARDTQQGGAVFLRLLGRSYTEPSTTLQEAIRVMHEPVIEQFKSAFAEALPQLPSEEFYWRMHFMVGLLAYMMSGTDMMRLVASCRRSDPMDTDAMIRRLRVFLSAGMRAPLPEIDSQAGPSG
jgi:AcrR family transcriptional regulator